MNQLRRAGLRRKGEPVWVLVAIIGGWIGVRAATWDGANGAVAPDPGTQHATAPQIARRTDHARHPLAVLRSDEEGAGQGPLAMQGVFPMMSDGLARPDTRTGARPDTLTGPPGGTMVTAGGHQLLWLAAIARMPLTYDLARHAAALADANAVFSSAKAKVPVPVDAVQRADTDRPPALVDPRAALLFDAPAAPVRQEFVRQGYVLPRWSADGWLLMRDGGGSPATVGSLLLPSYGANQVGAVLRYRLAPASAYRPTVYTRAYAALNGTGEREVAAGLSARPVRGVPIIAMAEARISRFVGGANHLRPALSLVTELAPLSLPAAMRADTYVQAGYVGGLGATLFVDGQFRLEHVARHSPHAELRLGGGVWGGAQKGAGRMDMGPTATLAFNTARAGAHVSVDWRLRVAGNARPGSGPAITLAAGF